MPVDPAASQQPAQSIKCAHSACACMVSRTAEYCSDYCREQAAADGAEAALVAEDCDCGHTECNEPR